MPGISLSARHPSTDRLQGGRPPAMRTGFANKRLWEPLHCTFPAFPHSTPRAEAAKRSGPGAGIAQW